MKLNRILVFIVLLLAVLTMTGCVTITGEETTQETTTMSSPGSTSTIGVAPRVGWLAPGFELVDFDGRTVSLESLRGQYVMLNFWATWCGPCRAEMPFMQEVYENPDWSAQGLVMVAVNVGESASQAEAFMEEFGFEFLVILDSASRTAAAYNIRGIPSTFFIDRDGVIRDMRVGTFRSRAEIESILSSLIDG
jgi:peroxiredoxin